MIGQLVSRAFSRSGEVRGHVLGTEGDDVVVGLDGSGGSVNRSVGVDRALSIPIVYSSVARISEAFRSMPVFLALGFEGEWRQLPPNLRLEELICRKPNPEMSAGELHELLVAWMILRGDAYEWKEKVGGRVVARWPISPERVQVVRNHATRRKEYLVYASTDDPVPMWAGTGDDVVHHRGWGTDPLRGMGVVEAMSQLLRHTREQQEHEANGLRTMQKPSGVLQVPAGVGPDAVKRLEAGWKARAKGGTPVLPDGIEWKPALMSAADAQMIQSRNFTRQEWALVMRLGASMAMTDTGGSMHYDSAAMNGQDFVTFSTASWAARLLDPLAIDDSFPWQFTGGVPGRLVPRIDTSNFTRASDRERAQANLLEIKSGSLTAAEVRVKEGRPAIAAVEQEAAPEVPSNEGGGADVPQ